MRILVLSRSAWRNDNSTGRTLSDIMGAFPEAEIYCVSMREQASQNDISKGNFMISEKQMVRRLLLKGKVGAREDLTSSTGGKDSSIYNNSNAKSNILLWIAREILWSTGGWKNDRLKSYVDEVKPDVIFSPIFPGCYPQKLLLHLKKITNAKVVVFHMDDNYSLKKFSFSPIYWIYRLIKRGWVKKSSHIADIIYVISSIQKDEYEKSFKRECKLLTKAADFSKDAPAKAEYNSPLQLVYTGNIGLNRWRSLAHIAKVLQQINKDGVRAQLRIYTGNPITEKMDKALNIGESSFIMGSVSADKVAEIQKNADMLVHVESLDIKNKLIVRQSFSTKIVDYLAAARPIVAFGPKDVASIDHLVKNDCAVVADSEQELFEKLSAVISDSEKLNELSLKAYACGRKKHNKEDIESMLREDFYSLMQ